MFKLTQREKRFTDFCNACKASSDDIKVYEIYAGTERAGTSIMLCESCLENLAKQITNKLSERERKEN